MMVENPLQKVLQRMLNVVDAYGTAFVKVTFDSEKQTYNFNVLLPEHVIITYEKKDEA